MTTLVVKPKTRLLGATERYLWLSDQNSPKHFVVIAKISGTTTATEWEAALLGLQERHPLLRSEIEQDSTGRPRFVTGGHAPIPLRVMQRHDDRQWEAEAERLLRDRFPATGGPMLRATLVHSPGVSDIMLCAHHSIADGVCMASLVRDWAAITGGELMEPLELSPPHDEALVRLAAAAPLAPAAAPAAALGESVLPWKDRNVTWGSPELSITSRRLPDELAGRLLDRARAERTTMHGALTAGLLLAGAPHRPKWRDRPVRVMSAVNTRRFTGLADDELLLAILFPRLSYRLPGAGQLWELARRITDDLHSTLTVGQAADSVRLLGEFVEEATVSQVADAELTASANDLLVSNLGRLAFRSDAGRLRIEAIWGPAVLVGNEDEQMVGVATLEGAIHLLHTSYSPIQGLLADCERVLTDAVRGTGRPPTAFASAS
jgi:hypothetical protein